MAPKESEAYEPDWYRTMKALAERQHPTTIEEVGADAVSGLPRLPREQASGIAQIAALEAVEALGDIGGGSAVTALLECLDDPDAPVRIRVIEMLGDLGDRRAVPAIRTLAGEDPDTNVVNVAKVTLTRLDAP